MFIVFWWDVLLIINYFIFIFIDELLSFMVPAETFLSYRIFLKEIYFLLNSHIVFFLATERVRPKNSEAVGGGDSPARGSAVGGEGEEGDSGIDANSQGSCSSNEVKSASKDRRKDKKKKKSTGNSLGSGGAISNMPVPEPRLPTPTSSKTIAEVIWLEACAIYVKFFCVFIFKLL